jgi:hypothetical protein
VSFAQELKTDLFLSREVVKDMLDAPHFHATPEYWSKGVLAFYSLDMCTVQGCRKRKVVPMPMAMFFAFVVFGQRHPVALTEAERKARLDEIDVLPGWFRHTLLSVYGRAKCECGVTLADVATPDFVLGD